jgi:O-succinylbenzoic acid--CoA ligase
MERTVSDLDYLFTEENTYLVPPHITNSETLIRYWEETGLTHHAFITSSGTTSNDRIKSFALSYHSLRNNAQAVNALLNASSQDRWLSSLPIYHIGGLSIYIRAKLSNSEVIRLDGKWDPAVLHQTVLKENIQFCSLVPTQLFDLIQRDLKAPGCLKAVFIGGDFLATTIKEKAIDLGWPIYLTYGMTEVCSQLATAHYSNIVDNMLPVLPIHDCKLFDGRLGIKSKSLFTASYQLKDDSFAEIQSEIMEDHFLTNDRVELTQLNDKWYIRPLGRIGDEIKINGRLIDLNQCRDVLANISQEMGVYGQVELVSVPNERSGKQIEMWIERNCSQHSEKLKELLLKQLPFLNISGINVMDKLPRTALGKLKKEL